MAKYEVTKVVERESKTTGKKYKSISVLDEEGFETQDVGVFDKLNEVVVGATLEGEVAKSANGKFTNFNFPRAAKGGSNSGMIAKAQETKRENIREAMDRKEHGILLSGAQRDATLWVTTFYSEKGWDTDELKNRWKEMRDWFINEYEKGTDLPFND